MRKAFRKAAKSLSPPPNEKAAAPGAASPAGWTSLLLAVSVALLSIVAGLAAEVYANAPKPKIGKPITARHYAIDVNKLAGGGGSGDDDPFAALRVAAGGKLAATLVRSSKDDSLRQFLASSAAATASKQGQVVTYTEQHLSCSLQRYLGWSFPDASGYAQAASLYVASQQQFGALVGPPAAHRTLLDVGSGTGTETVKLSAALGIQPGSVACLETSGSLRATLGRKGFRAASSPAELGSQRFSVASLLNVLDRADKPGQLLDAVVDMLEPGGLLVVATVLPFTARVYEGRVLSKWYKASSRKPHSPLALVPVTTGDAASFESCAAAFLATILRLRPELELERWSRLPYVSSGDTWRTHYTIDMAIMTFRVPTVGSGDGGSSEAAGGHSPAAAAAPPPPPPTASSVERTIPARCKKQGGDKIFSWISRTIASEGGPSVGAAGTRSSRSWGNVLDAGSGINSLCWLLHQPDYSSIIAVTARSSGTDSYGDRLQAIASSAGGGGSGAAVEVVVGNWRDGEFMRGRRFDVVVADYLLGSTELHWAYGADELMDRLLEVVNPGGFLVIVGLEPYELVLDRGFSQQDRLVLDIEAIGDSAVTLAGETTYRELPEQWVRDRVERRRPEFRVVAAKQCAMTLTAKSLGKQLAYARKTAAKIADPGLQKAYVERIAELDLELRDGFATHRRAQNYAMVIQRQEHDY